MELYWLLRLPHLHDFITAFAIISLLLGFFGLLSNKEKKDDIEKRNCTISSYLIIAFPVLLFINNFIPDKTDLALMLGWDALKSDSVQEVIEILKEKIK